MFLLSPELVCAMCSVESSWEPYACRYEPGFKLKYVDKIVVRRFGSITVETEAFMRSCSWGLMQVMGQVAREAGFTGPFLSALSDPDIGVSIGCQRLFLLRKKYNLTDAISAYNAGTPTSANASYVKKVLAEQERYEKLLYPSRNSHP